jgi:hypothetical protein
MVRSERNNKVATPRKGSSIVRRSITREVSELIKGAIQLGLSAHGMQIETLNIELDPPLEPDEDENLLATSNLHVNISMTASTGGFQSENNLKLFLEDASEAPTDWLLVRWPKDAIAHIKTGKVTEISLTNELGSTHPRKMGMEVLRWIKDKVVTIHLSPPRIRIHAGDPVIRAKMEEEVRLIERLYEENR